MFLSFQLSCLMEGWVIRIKNIPNTIFIENVEYRLVTLRGRSKYVSKNGDLINPYRNQKATIHYNEDHYPCAGGGIPVHLYVAYGWVDGWFEDAEVNHKDFDRNNYCADNLEWVTHEQNIKYSNQYNYETMCKAKQGVHNGRATFTEEDIRNIRKLYDQGKTVAEIVKIYHPELQTAKQYHNIHSTFSNIVQRKTWKHIS